MLAEQVKAKLANRAQQLRSEGKLLSPEQLEPYYANFRKRFGPDALAALEGQDLLETMHGGKDKMAMAYWLEHKNDDEFRNCFGGIGGGNAWRGFEVYLTRKGTWAIGEKQVSKDIPVEDAIAIARKQRDQLLKGAEVLTQLSQDADDAQYERLQANLHRVAPDVANTAWGHKYLSLIFPHKVDCFHNPDWQRFHLLKLLQQPPEGDGRYICAGRFAAAARELSLTMHGVYSLLLAVNRYPHGYWRIAASDTTFSAEQWARMRDDGFVAIGWQDLDNLSFLDGTKQSTEQLNKMLAAKYPNAELSKAKALIRKFVLRVGEDDLVLACAGPVVRGIGKVSGPYRHVPDSPLPHQKPVQWLSLDEWKLSNAEDLPSPVCDLWKDASQILEIERRVQEQPSSITIVTRPGQIPPLEGIAGRIQSILDRKRQVILYGPPGTGKTYWAKRTACELAALRAFRKPFDDLDDASKETVRASGPNAGLVRLCCFHSGYGYEDFIEGYRPRLVDGHIAFVPHDGLFKQVCNDARKSPDRWFYLVVDEINRGDIPRIFGELLTVLEADKRKEPVLLPISGEPLVVPPNLFLIGTMNTADRSISLLDAALRRRFGFVEVMPDIRTLKGVTLRGIPLAAWLKALNRLICQHIGRDGRHLQIGHSYFLQGERPVKEFSAFAAALRDDVLPLLEEYCYADLEALPKILGQGFVDPDQGAVRQDLFDEGKEEELIQILLAMCPGPEVTAGGPALDEDAETEDEGGSP